MNILISGAGIAGPTLAYWLLGDGFTPTLVEKASGIRTGGYVLDFFGLGYDTAEAMGIVPQLQQKGYGVAEVRMVGRDGRRLGGFPVEALRRVLKGRYVSLPRGDLASSIHEALGDRVETILG